MPHLGHNVADDGGALQHDALGFHTRWRVVARGQIYKLKPNRWQLLQAPQQKAAWRAGPPTFFFETWLMTSSAVVPLEHLIET
jgi:hypothetical protein